MAGEFVLLRRLASALPPPGDDVLLGIGDDAAIVEVAGTAVVFAVDAVVDGVHFDRELSSAADVGWKVIAQNVSDLAAMGAPTAAAVVALHLPHAVEDGWIDRSYDGMAEAAAAWGLEVVGGDVVSSEVLSLSVAVIGPAPRNPLRRDAARPGDAVALVGEVGLAAAGLRLWQGGHRDLLEEHPDLLRAHRRPRALPGAGTVLSALGARAAIDISDGLGRDAGHVATASEVSLILEEERLPAHEGVAAAEERLGDPWIRLGGGDDLALLVTLPAGLVGEAERAVGAAGHRFTVIGRVEAGRGVTLLRTDGTRMDVSGLGYEHGRG